MNVPIFQVDAFSAEPFGGNPAAVCFPVEALDDRTMQLVAREMNLSETAFVVPEEDAFRLRWFTPTVEVDLCGHATLAAAHALWETGRLEGTAVARFLTRSGELTARRPDGGDPAILLDFPATPPEPSGPIEGLAEALGAEPVRLGRSRFDVLAELESDQVVRALRPDLRRLASVEARGVIVTARSDDRRFDFVSRFFAPATGVDEDPVTGSAHCCLAPFWASRLGQAELRAYQASERGGELVVRTRDDRVELLGRAITVMRGELIV